MPKLNLTEKILIALVVAVVIHVLTTRHAPAQSVGFIPSGTWITTERGEKVCQLTVTIARGMPTPGPGFCMNWQPPFRPLMRGDIWPTGEGWVRASASYPAISHLQFHTEQGWKP